MTSSELAVLRVVRGHPTASELAALVVVLRALPARGGDLTGKGGRPAWTASGPRRSSSVSWRDR
ncbi:acyl-CoA carboxylase subunit epsilon [Frankia sp. AgB32]|uniref:acyl-CoA carboxylase subunit epsilon n=1 Tax=Frankia sp. AgB32 TaxID=631119 RepID=UPI00200D9C94|nr:acyl-CoA carboxylase subunit epsilon [Frankia sp. AgB32]MCK9897341.1 acyl-CoA carboxylase subunit epsilon [Frankia sp. AgB32]